MLAIAESSCQQEESDLNRIRAAFPFLAGQLDAMKQEQDPRASVCIRAVVKWLDDEVLSGRFALAMGEESD